MLNATTPRQRLFDTALSTLLDGLEQPPEQARPTVAQVRHALADPPCFFRWMESARGEFDWRARHFTHQAGIFAALDAITRGELRRLILSIAVRHGKTESLVSYLAYRLIRNPKLRVLFGSYNQQQADKISRQIRNLVRAAQVALSDERDAAREWETAAGGALQAVGAGTGVASINADIIVIDDPVGSREDAESLAEREKVWDWITNDILARCTPTTSVIVSHPRWHQDDVIGRLRERQAARWRVIDLPGRAEDGDPLGRALGAPLWPERLGDAWLEEKREELGEYGFASLVQGRPRPREGGMFKWEWWRLLDAVPADGWMIRYWDTAGTRPRGGKHDPDYTAGTLECRLPSGATAIVDVERMRCSIAERDARIEQVCREDLERYPGRVVWWLEAESGIAGADRTADLVRRIANLGMAIHTEHPTGKKELRAEPFASAAEAGNVLLCPGAWRDAFRTEAADFPNGRHDDQVDTAAAAFIKLATPGAWSPVRVVF